jgi:hypothetical protein
MMPYRPIACRLLAWLLLSWTSSALATPWRAAVEYRADWCPHGRLPMPGPLPVRPYAPPRWALSTPPIQTTLFHFAVKPWPTDSIGRVLARHHHRLNACYQSAFETQLDHGGRFRIALLARPDGSVQRVRLQGAAPSDDDLVGCLRRTLRLVTLPATSKGGRAAFTLLMVPPFKLPGSVRGYVDIGADIPVSPFVRTRLRNCLATALSIEPRVDQSVSVRFRIDPFGVPQDVTQTDAHGIVQALTTCATRRVKELRLDPQNAGQWTDLTIRFRGHR